MSDLTLIWEFSCGSYRLRVNTVGMKATDSDRPTSISSLFSLPKFNKSVRGFRIRTVNRVSYRKRKSILIKVDL